MNCINKEYVSNTLAGTGNQFYFSSDGIQTGRIFYKVFERGKFDYSFLFSNTIDSTFSDGKLSHKDMPCKKWHIYNMRVKVYNKNYFGNIVPLTIKGDEENFNNVTFNGKVYKDVQTDEIFYTDNISLEADKGDYICVEIKFSGDMIPYHHELWIPSYILNGDSWQLNSRMPCPWQVGCNRKINKRIAFLGDSITQGIGTEVNSYDNWCSLLAEKIGEKNAYWNLGIGCGRADDCAIDGKWMLKAKNNDIVFVCFGVNDINQKFSEESIKSNFQKVVDILNNACCSVILLTIPPFDYEDERITIWQNVNRFIKDKLSQKVVKVVDIGSVLSKSEKEPYMAKFGGHPDKQGCMLLADYIYENIKNLEIFN